MDAERYERDEEGAFGPVGGRGRSARASVQEASEMTDRRNHRVVVTRHGRRVVHDPRRLAWAREDRDVRELPSGTWPCAVSAAAAGSVDGRSS